MRERIAELASWYRDTLDVRDLTVHTDHTGTVIRDGKGDLFAKVYSAGDGTAELIALLWDSADANQDDAPASRSDDA